MTDLRKEQLMLWRFEQQLVGLATTVAAGAATVKAVDGSIGGGAGSDGLARVQELVLQLARATADAHAALQMRAIETGATLWQTSAGGPKDGPDPVRAIASIFGIG